MNTILFIAPANTVHSYRWIKFFEKDLNCLWLSYYKISHELKTEFKIKNDIIYNKFFRNFFLLLSPFYTIYIFLKYKPRIVHIHSLGLNFFASIFLIIFFRKKVVMTPWGSDIYNNFFRTLICKFIFRNHYFTTDSFEIKKILNNFSTRNKIYKINFGININFYNQKFKNKSLTNKKIILCPRGYDEIYNNDLILNFIKLNKEYLTDYKFLFLGKKNKNKLRITNLANNLGIKSFCIFFNLVNQKKLLDLYKSSEFVVSASRSDAGISSSIAEAMCCKKIVLCTYNKDNPYWIQHGENGFLFLDNNINDFKKSFFAIISTSSRDKIKIAEKALKTQIKFNSYNTEMKKVLKIYDYIIK